VKTKEGEQVEQNKNKQTNFVTFSLQANSTDWATANDRQILVPTFADRGMSHGQRGFLDRSLNFFFEVAPHLSP
jgi:hypothetical protein